MSSHSASVSLLISGFVGRAASCLTSVCKTCFSGSGIDEGAACCTGGGTGGMMGDDKCESKTKVENVFVVKGFVLVLL